MKTLFTVLALAAVATLAGCGQGEPGGPGASIPSAKKALGTAEDTFKLDVPNLATHVKQGESKKIAISLNRGKNFDQDVTLKFHNVPKGVTFDPPSPVMKHGDKEVQVTVHAADDAALGDFTIEVFGHPTKGADATNKLEISIAKK